MYLCSRDVIFGKIVFLFLYDLALICRNLSKTCCYCPVIQSLAVQHIRIGTISKQEDLHTDSGQLSKGQGHFNT